MDLLEQREVTHSLSLSANGSTRTKGGNPLVELADSGAVRP